jgi:hypothetical protein
MAGCSVDTALPTTLPPAPRAPQTACRTGSERVHWHRRTLTLPAAARTAVHRGIVSDNDILILP